MGTGSAFNGKVVWFLGILTRFTFKFALMTSVLTDGDGEDDAGGGGGCRWWVLSFCRRLLNLAGPRPVKSVGCLYYEDWHWILIKPIVEIFNNAEEWLARAPFLSRLKRTTQLTQFTLGNVTHNEVPIFLSTQELLKQVVQLWSHLGNALFPLLEAGREAVATFPTSFSILNYVAVSVLCEECWRGGGDEGGQRLPSRWGSRGEKLKLVEYVWRGDGQQRALLFSR